LSLAPTRLERMFSVGGLEAVVDQLRAAVAIDPAGLDAASAVRMFDLFAQAERLSGAGKLLCARRVEDTSAFRQDGSRSAADWVAQRSGVGLGAAINGLETARRMETLDTAAVAWQRGELSPVQAQEISQAAAAAPEKEADLVAVAKSRSVKGLPGIDPPISPPTLLSLRAALLERNSRDGGSDSSETDRTTSRTPGLRQR
jgi:hypothetical protein